MPQTVWLVEDSLQHLTYLKQCLQKTAVKLPFTFDVKEVNPIHFYEHLADYPIQDGDVFLLDIELYSYFNGIDLAKNIRKSFDTAYIVFWTNYDSYGLSAINSPIQPFYYLVKKFLEEEMVAELHKLFMLIDKDFQMNNKKMDIFIFPQGNEKKIVNKAEIDFIASMKTRSPNVIIQLSDKETYFCQGTVRKFQDEFTSPMFTRDLKSYIVNLEQVSGVNRSEKLIIFRSGNTLSVGVRIIRKIADVLTNLDV